jgi:hypothetical protein
MNNNLNITVLRRLLAQRKLVNDNIHNVAMSMLKPGTKIQYMVNERSYFGSVEGIAGIPGTTRIKVKNLQTQKVRDIYLADITGLVQEN